jgi:DNA-binding CsgD family transcriptional regulator
MNNLIKGVYELWDELADLPLADTRGSMDLLFGQIVKWIGADNAFWVGTVRIKDIESDGEDILYGWRLRAAERWRPSPEEDESFIRKILSHMERDPGMTTREIIRQSGRFRSYRLHDGFIDMDAYRKTPQYQLYFQQSGITDRIWCVFPVNEDAESMFCFDRIRRRKRFSCEDERIVQQTLRGIKWYHRQLLLNHGLLVGEAPLSPTHRRVLPHLLSEKSEKEIAGTLGLTPATTHKYVTDIYRSFNVTSRAGLITLWMGGR